MIADVSIVAGGVARTATRTPKKREALPRSPPSPSSAGGPKWLPHPSRATPPDAAPHGRSDVVSRLERIGGMTKPAAWLLRATTEVVDSSAWMGAASFQGKSM